MGAIAVGCIRAADLWDSMGTAALARTVAVDGFLWPVSLIKWIT